MEESLFIDEEGVDLLNKAKNLFSKGDYIHALEITEDLLLVHTEPKESCILHLEQGKLFMELANAIENRDVEFTYNLAAVECFWDDATLSGECADTLYDLGEQSGSVLYYKKCIEKAKQALAVVRGGHDMDSVDVKILREELKEQWKGMEGLIKKAENKIARSKTSPLKNCESEVLEVKESSKLVDTKGELRKYWLGLDIKIKREFLRVKVEEVLSLLKGGMSKKRREDLEAILASAKEERKWMFWMCRTLCSTKFSSADECRKHLEEKHGADFKPSSEKDAVKPTGKDWAQKITKGAWEPVDAVAAAEMIKNPLGDAKTFKANSGWSKEWPLTVDEERSKLLKEIQSLLVLIRDGKVFSSSIRNWLVSFAVRHLGKLGVSEQKFDEFHLVKTPQSICFLDGDDLVHIRDFLKTIKCERDDGTDLVCRAVDSFLDRTRVKEKIDFDPNFSVLLLDKRLLKSIDVPWDDDDGTINVCDPEVHYAKAHAQGDDIITWLGDYASVDNVFAKPIREHNLDIWVAVLRAVQFTCRNLEAQYAKKLHVLDYDAALTNVENLCKSEDERRRNLQEDEWIGYSPLLCDIFEQCVTENSLSTKAFLFALQEVLEKASQLTNDLPDDCLNLISERKRDDRVLKSIHLLKSEITHKVLQIDSKIMLIDNSRIKLLSNLTRLSVFDNRTYMLRLLKPFLLCKIITMKTDPKSEAVKADVSLEEAKKSGVKKLQPKNKKKNNNTKRTSTSMSRPLDKIVEHEPSVSLDTVEEDSAELEDTLGGEMDRSEISSNADNQEKATEVEPGTQNMPEQPLEPALRGTAAMYNSAFDMTLKALLNIKVLKEDLKCKDDLEVQVSCALQKFFAAFVSEEVKNEETYRVYLSDLLASLKEVSPMSSNAAEVFVDIVEFWQCWKSPESGSLVNRLFTFEETESTSCRKCRRKSNYPEQSAYGIVMDAESIKELKCAFGNMKFVDILKKIRMETKMLCDKKTGGCGEANTVDHIISRCPPIFTVVLEWEKSATEKGISETTKALDWEIDISRLYKGLKPNTNYRLVSMVGCNEEEEEYVCLAYETIRWVNLRRESFEGEVVGTLKNVVKFCEDRKVHPVILFYEAA